MAPGDEDLRKPLKITGLLREASNLENRSIRGKEWRSNWDEWSKGKQQNIPTKRNRKRKDRCLFFLFLIVQTVLQKNKDPIHRMEDSTPEEILHTTNLTRIITQLMRFYALSSHWYGCTRSNAVVRGLLFFLKKQKLHARVNAMSL